MTKKISLYFFYFWACFPVTIKSISSLPKGFRCNIYRKCYEIVRKAFTALKNLEKKKKKNTTKPRSVWFNFIFIFITLNSWIHVNLQYWSLGDSFKKAYWIFLFRSDSKDNHNCFFSPILFCKLTRNLVYVT